MISRTLIPRKGEGFREQPVMRYVLNDFLAVDVFEGRTLGASFEYVRGWFANVHMTTTLMRHPVEPKQYDFNTRVASYHAKDRADAMLAAVDTLRRIGQAFDSGDKFDALIVEFTGYINDNHSIVSE